jgi:twinkle protein
MTTAKTYADYGIEIKTRSTTGQHYTTCPKCSHDRKKKNAKCLGVNLDLQIWHCTHCDWRGSLRTKIYATPPAWENKTTLPDNVVEFFQQRNIKQETLTEMRITDGIEFMPQAEERRRVINFNYFRDGKLVNVKYRDRDKNFKLFKDAELIFYNLDGIKDATECYIVEGEIDALTMIQAGYKNTVSVPNGANKKNNNLAYLDNCYQHFEAMKTVYVMTDNDEPGDKLADELARRIGIEKCKRVKFEDFKDINEAYSNGAVIKDLIVESAKPYPIEGVKTIDDYWESFLDITKNGHKPGWKPRGGVGKKIQFYPGYLTIATGIPGHGKSEEIDQITMELSVDYDLRGAYFSPENSPTELHILKLVEKVIGKKASKCNDLELKKAHGFLKERVFWVYPEEGYNIDLILEKIRQCVLKYGINWYVLDPWNRLEHQYNESETKYISETLDKITNFNKRNGVHCFLVAHPTKMKFNYEKDKYEIPGLYDISGSANFYNKADVGLTIYKEKVDMPPGAPSEYRNALYIQKVKFKHWGEPGTVELRWNKENGRFDSESIDLTNWLDKPAKQGTLAIEKPEAKQVIMNPTTNKTYSANGTTGQLEADDEIPF